MSRASFYITWWVMAIHVALLFIFSTPSHTAPPPKKMVVVTKHPTIATTISEKVVLVKSEPIRPKQLLEKIDQKPVTPKKAPPKPKKKSAVKKAPPSKPLPKSPPAKQKKPDPPPLIVAAPEDTGEVKSVEDAVFVLQLCELLEKQLVLPEKGAVKLTITVQANGKIDKIRVLAVESEENLRYLQEMLPQLELPSREGETECVITFCDE